MAYELKGTIVEVLTSSPKGPWRALVHEEGKNKVTHVKSSYHPPEAVTGDDIYLQGILQEGDFADELTVMPNNSHERLSLIFQNAQKVNIKSFSDKQESILVALEALKSGLVTHNVNSTCLVVSRNQETNDPILEWVKGDTPRPEGRGFSERLT